MRKFTTSAVILTALAILLSGCIKDGRMADTPEAGKPVQFSTSISETRAYDNMWEPGDRIGVYMLVAGTDDWSGTALLSENMQYGLDLDEPKAGAVFSGVDEENTLKWPEDNGTVDFVAYYPYQTSISSDFRYTVDVSDQSEQKDIDLMWADNAKTMNASSENPRLAFRHKLTKLIFNVTDLEQASLDGMVSTFTGLNTTAKFDLSTGAIVAGSEDDPEEFNAHRVSSSTSGSAAPGVNDKALVEAIVLPGEDLSYTLTFVLAEGGGTARFTVTNVDYEVGNKYIYNISLNPRNSVAFGEANGDLSSIYNWNEVTPGDIDIDKDGDGGAGRNGDLAPEWNSGPLSETSSGEFTVSQNAIPSLDGSYKVPAGEVMTIAKDNDKGIVSVTVRARANAPGTGEISVKAGGSELVYSEGGIIASFSDSGYNDFVFRAPDGTPVTGDIEITVKASNAATDVLSFAVNSDMP